MTRSFSMGGLLANRSGRRRRSQTVGRPNLRRLNIQPLEARILLAGDLVARWRADDLTGIVETGEVVTSWTDSIGGIAATSLGEPRFVQRAIGDRATVRFEPANGSDALQVGADVSPVSGVEDFSIAVVFATDSQSLVGDGGPWFENTGLVDASQLGFRRDWGMSIDSTGSVSVGMGAGFGRESTTLYSSATELNDGRMHVAIFTRRGSQISLYVDGRLAGSRSDANADPRFDSSPMSIGQLLSGNNPFDGEIAEVSVYDGMLDAAEADDLFNQVAAFYTNVRPTAFDDHYRAVEDPLVFAVSDQDGVLANDLNPEAEPLIAELVDDVRHGTLVFNPDGSFVYAPKTDFFGTDSFSYRAVDFRGSNIATVSIEVAPVYDPAIPVADSYKLLPTQTLSVHANLGVLSNDQNPDQVSLKAVLDADVTSGNLTLNDDGSFLYDPLGRAGEVSFRYRIDDGTNVSDPIQVGLTINTPPIAQSDTYDVIEDTWLSTNVAQGVLANDLDSEGDQVLATVLSEPAHGLLGLETDGSFLYSPDPDFFGLDSFTYTIADGTDESRPATVQLNVAPVNDPARATPDIFIGRSGEEIATPGERGVLSNDSDVDNALLAAVLTVGPEHGTLELRDDGSFSYIPQAGFTGTDRFSYTVHDSESESAPADVRLFVGTSPVRISEILVANATSMTTRTRATGEDAFRGDQEREDWIELRNLTDATLDLSGYHLTDVRGNDHKWKFPEGTTIGPYGRLTLFASRLNITNPILDEQGRLHTNFTLRVEGEYLALTSPGGIVLHEFDTYPSQVPDVSYGITNTGDAGYFVETTPDAENSTTYEGLVDDPEMSVDHGFYSEPFTLQITTSTADAMIRYTTDGSTPTSTHGELYASPIEITTTTALRAAAFRENRVPSKVVTSTYLFLRDVIRQGNAPAGYPDTWLGDSGVGTTPADYEMDPEITLHPAYQESIDDALLSIPTVSIVTDVEHLFDTETGIYQRPERHGWERPVSVELIYPDGTPGFQENAGVRIQGGHTRSPSGSPKHSFRLRFRGIYGAEKLRYDWFGGDAVEAFDTIVLRAGGNQSWIHTNTWMGDNRSRAQYVRDQWAKDTYRAMGRPASHNDYAHLYVNGLYWGLYNPTERPTADFAASYFGGESEEYDVLNAGVVLDGDNRAWRELADRALKREVDLSDEAQYQSVAEMLDIEAYIDYLILNHFGGNMDWDSHNWYAVRRRQSEAKFQFIPWDSEFFFIKNNDNRLRVADGFPGQLFRKLRGNNEFRMLLADRIQSHLFNDGALTTESVLERWEVRSRQVEMAIVAESARWGDYRRDVEPRGGPFELLERDVQWTAERDRLLNDYFPHRRDIVLEQYRSLDLYPSVDAPTFNVRGGRVSSGFDLELSAAEGAVFYTTDGSDPRLPGGELNPLAIEYVEPIRLGQPSTIRARTLSGAVWSAIDEATFVVDVVPADGSNLRISEIHYNPAPPRDEEIALGFDDNDDFEFVELVNISDRRIDLKNVQFQQLEFNGDLQGIAFDFSAGAIAYLEPGQYAVVVEDTEAFASRYGDGPLIVGQWTGQLSNGGEQLTLSTDGALIQQFTYDDAWYDATDGRGFSLELVDPRHSTPTAWSTKSAWRVSDAFGGSPGVFLGPVPGDVNGDGVFNSSDLVPLFQSGEYEDSTVGNSTFAEGDWNGDGDFTSSDLVFAFQVGMDV